MPTIPRKSIKEAADESFNALLVGAQIASINPRYGVKVFREKDMIEVVGNCPSGSAGSGMDFSTGLAIGLIMGR